MEAELEALMRRVPREFEVDEASVQTFDNAAAVGVFDVEAELKEFTKLTPFDDD